MALSALQREIDADQASALLETLPAQARVEWALENLPGSFVLSSSFGIQSAVLLHLATRIVPDLPVQGKCMKNRSTTGFVALYQ